jgi:hypothetical protein
MQKGTWFFIFIDGVSGTRSFSFPPESPFAVLVVILFVLMWISLSVVVLGLHWHSLDFCCIFSVISRGRSFTSSAYIELVKTK